jgi:hypothetical protein
MTWAMEGEIAAAAPAEQDSFKNVLRETPCPTLILPHFKCSTKTKPANEPWKINVVETCDVVTKQTA